MTILWLTDRKGYSPETKKFLLKALASGGVGGGSIFFNSLHLKVPALADLNVKKAKMPEKGDQNAARHALNTIISQLQVTLLVTDDVATARIIAGKPYMLGTIRGSIYRYNELPCIVLDRVASIYQPGDGKFCYEMDLGKVCRYALGKRKAQPSFNFHVCRTVSEVRAFCGQARASIFCAIDTETSSGFITCISYTFVSSGGQLSTFCVPFFDPFCEGGCYWARFEDELAVRLALKNFNASPNLKGFQNGTYDCAYLIAEGMPPENYLVDTENLMHSIWIEARKKLHELASLFVDNYTYWKDDKKGIEEDGWGKDHSALDAYWRYNGLDTYYTWLVAYELLSIIVSYPWALFNYNRELRLSVGPCLAASLRGLKLNEQRHAQIMAKKIKESEDGKRDIQKLTGEVDFNINSSNDVAWFLYDVLGAKTTRLQKARSKYGPRSTDEKVLKLIKEQGNVIINNFIDRLLRAKKPGTLLSNFGNLNRLCHTNGRFMSKHSTAGTTTGRFNSGKSQFWVGRNGQNWEPELRELIVADPDYVLVEIDYSASDDRFIGYESEDSAKIEQVESGKNTHCYHASIFFSKPYETILAGYKNNERWVVHATEGVRQITKHITHGRNFRMGAGTLYNNMGRDAVIATAIYLGHDKAERYSDKELIAVCDDLIDTYDHPRKGLYKRIRPWQDEIVELACRNGNLVTCAHGMTRLFFGDLRKDHAKQRELSAFYGQGGTAGNCNTALDRIFYNNIDNGQDCLFLLQGHDSILFSVHRTALYKIRKIRAIMEQEFQVHGRTLRIPTDPKIGLTWSKDMLEWTEATTYEDVVKFEQDKFGKKYPVQITSTLDVLNSLYFGEQQLANLQSELAKFEAQDEDILNDDNELELICQME